jgi:predicted ester cyclase
MSVEENKEIVRRIYDELWNGRNLEVADELIAHPFGPEEMKGTIRMVTRGFPDNVHRVEEMIAEGEIMGIPPTGRKIAVNEIHIYRLENGKAVEHRVGRDDLGAMRQLGVIADAVPVPEPPRESEVGV